MFHQRLVGEIKKTSNSTYMLLEMDDKSVRLKRIYEDVKENLEMIKGGIKNLESTRAKLKEEMQRV